MYTCLKHYIWKLQVFFPNFVVCKKILIYSYTIIITFMLTKKAFKIFYYYTIIMRIVTENNGNYKKTSKVIILITIKGIWRKMCLHLNKLECRGKVYGLSLWRILHKTDTIFFLRIVGLLYIYCICTQYLVGAPFALITASIRRGMEVISLWHCWGGLEAQVSLTVAFYIWQWICIFWSLVSHFPLDNTP